MIEIYKYLQISVNFPYWKKIVFRKNVILATNT